MSTAVATGEPRSGSGPSAEVRSSSVGAATAARASQLASEIRRGRSSSVIGEEGSSAPMAGQNSPLRAGEEVQLTERIRKYLPHGHVEVKLTNNRYTMLSVRCKCRSTATYSVRLHHMFVEAEEHVIRSLALYISKNDSSASKTLGDYIDTNQHRIRSRTTQTPKLETKGECHDLQEIYDKINAKYFNDSIDAVITWGQRCGKERRRNSIKMGSYSIEERCIRIHRSLDKAYVPQFFVESVVYHEMLHQVHQAPVVNGRHQFHSKAFLEDEAKFEHFALATVWERDHLERLLTY